MGVKRKANWGPSPSIKRVRQPVRTWPQTKYRPSVGFQANSKGVLTATSTRSFVTTRTVTSQANLISSVSAGVGIAWGFGLSDLPGYTEFTGLFDQYRIKEVELKIVPEYTDYTPNSNVGGSAFIYTSVDFDNATTPTLASIAESETCTLHKSNQPITIKIQPRTDFTLSGQTNAAMAPAGQWIDCASPAVTHYGVKAFIPQGTTNTGTWHCVCRYTCEFRNSR